MAARVGICAKCGRIKIIYDIRADVCFACYQKLSPFGGKEKFPKDKN